jgi:methyltransferase (TIGR00027 family)
MLRRRMNNNGTLTFQGIENIMEDVISEFSVLGKVKGSSTMAEVMAMRRFSESGRPEGERICYDPYAVHFINHAILRSAAEHPEEAKAKSEQVERLFPGLGNSIVARVRYFDDFVAASVDKGIRQLVILGAGYDTRAYRIENLKRDVRVFEIDHPDTQTVKKRIIRQIFGSLPGNVTYVPLDFERESLDKLLKADMFDRSKKTLILFEGLVMYLPPSSVDETLHFITRTFEKGSLILFDNYPQSLVDGTDTGEVAANIREFTRRAGEPLKFGMPDGESARFLADRGYTNIQVSTSSEYRRLYFHGKNVDRSLSDYLTFVSAEVP